jgi:hypothetical protein
VFEGVERNEGFNRKRAKEQLHSVEKLSRETAAPCMADIVANKGVEFRT